MPVKGASSLYETSKRQALRMMKNIDDLGEMPFSVAEPLLKKVQTAQHLYRLEQNCPQFVGNTRDIWMTMIKRDLPQWDGTEPKNPASWYKLYQKLYKAETRATEADAMLLKQTMDKLAAEKEGRQILTTNMLHKSKVRGSRTAKPDLNSNQSSLRFNSGSRTKMVTGKDVLARARREARERSHALSSHSVLARPTHMLNQKATTIRQAPAGLIQQHQQNQSSPAPRPHPAASGRAAPPVSSRQPTQEEREARLRAAKERQRPVQNVISSKRKIDDLEDLFGDSSDSDLAPVSDSPPKKKSNTSPPAPTSTSRKPAANVFLTKPARRPIRP